MTTICEAVGSLAGAKADAEAAYRKLVADVAAGTTPPADAITVLSTLGKLARGFSAGRRKHGGREGRPGRPNCVATADGRPAPRSPETASRA